MQVRSHHFVVVSCDEVDSAGLQMRQPQLICQGQHACRQLQSACALPSLIETRNDAFDAVENIHLQRERMTEAIDAV